MDLRNITKMISKVAVVLPDGGLLDVVDHFTETLQFLSQFIGCSVLPLNLRLAATRQSVDGGLELDLQNCQLAVNHWSWCLFKAFSFVCFNFVDIATEDHGVSVSRGQLISQIRVVVPVGLPD